MNLAEILLGLILLGQGERSQVKVVLCDQIGLDDQAWQVARAEAARVFESAGVDLVWLDVERGVKECKLPPMSIYPEVVITRNTPKGWTTAQAMGFSPALANRSYIFYDPVKRFVRTFRSSERESSAIGVILGHAIAHELGHLLVPGCSHRDGVMQAGWGFEEWQRAFSGTLLFHPDQAKMLQAATAQTSVASAPAK